MSSNFAGFTEADIRKLKDKPKRVVKDLKNSVENDVLKLLESKPKMQVTHQALLSKHLEKIVEETIKNDSQSLETNTEEVVNNSEQIPFNSTLENDLKIELKIPIDLSDFEVKQKLIEEQNRVRKKQLMRRLADKSQKTKEEFRKLQIIQDEVNKLDNKLSNDVNVLRQNIDDLSLTFMTAEKRFLKLEREYLEAKLSLQKLQEKKELLTEHLCTVIVKNEERKAEKLTELLQLIDVQSDEKSNNNKNDDENETK